MNLVQSHDEDNSCAPVRCKQYSFDVNQQAQTLSAWEQRYTQHGSGQFNGYLDELKLPKLHLFEEYTSQTIHQECCVNPDALWIGFSLDEQRPKVNGRTAEKHQLMIRPAHEHFELTTPDNFNIFGIVIDRKLLANSIGLEELEGWENTCLIENSQASHGCWALVDLIKQSLSHHTALGRKLLNLTDPNQTQLQSQLIHLMEQSLIARLGQYHVAGTPEHSRGYLTRREALKRINNHIEQTGNYPLTINEMSSIACVSQRTLHYCFEKELGLSPNTFLRDCRLNAVRRDLLNIDEQRAICDIALHYGFYHLGTFNHYYKLLFAETPSQTRGRASKYQYVSVVKRFLR
ncbi:helix-turn-helix domain-containing protein [Vibrio diazotrophicus]|uniref:helix-turn-helix domain-containing protein n=1 Tax=Vibrio diazotrophicus TaxID=685 RepID=UPI0020CA8783|nr:helix-turn-helix domain-containing protein [Vibrio diazotrophicus]